MGYTENFVSVFGLNVDGYTEKFVSVFGLNFDVFQREPFLCVQAKR
jgi:hypothetical protein